MNALISKFKRSVYRFQLFIGFCRDFVVQACKPRQYWADIWYQFDRIGVGSLVIVSLTGLFTGMVFTLQTGVGMGRFGVTSRVGRVVVLGIIKELGPVLSALVFAGRAGASIAAETSSMVVTEQFDAIEAEGINPIKRVIVSRVLACIVMLPLLTFVADAIALVGGALIADATLGVSPSLFWSDVFSTLLPHEMVMGMIKPIFFGLVVGLAGTYYGMFSERDARGVGQATTRAVVNATIAVILLDFLITKVMVYWVQLS